MPVEDEAPEEATADYSGIAAYDVTEVRPDLRGPDGPQTPREALLDESGAVLPSFDPRVAEPFTGLIFLGALKRSFVWLGHSFVVRTLTADEMMNVGLVIRPYMGTIGEQRAYTTAMVAACILTIDGQELPIPVGLGTDDMAWLDMRFQYVRRNLLDFTIDRIYTTYLELRQVVEQVVAAMEKASGLTDLSLGSNDNSVGPTAEGFSPAEV